MILQGGVKVIGQFGALKVRVNFCPTCGKKLKKVEEAK